MPSKKKHKFKPLIYSKPKYKGIDDTVKLYENGGPVPPTSSDSLQVAKSAEEVRNYYTNKNYVIDEGHLGPLTFTDTYLHKNILKNTGEDEKRYYEEKPPTFKVGDKVGKPIPYDDYFKPLGDYKFKQREFMNKILDTRSPMPLYDTRIVPSSKIMLDNVDKDDPLYTDMVQFAVYDPLAVTPWKHLSEEDKKLRLEIYGSEGTPVSGHNANPELIKKRISELYKSSPKNKEPNLNTDLAAWLKTQGKPTSYAERKKLYQQVTGKDDYKGSAEQNIGLLNLLKDKGFDYNYEENSTKSEQSSEEIIEEDSENIETTFKESIEEDLKMGYKPYISPDGKIFTFSNEDKIPSDYKPYQMDEENTSNYTDKSKIKQNYHKEWNPFTKQYEPMSPQQYRMLDREAYKLRNQGVKLTSENMPQFEPELLDEISREKINLQQESTNQDAEFLTGLAPTFKYGGNMKNKKHKFKPIVIHPQTITPVNTITKVKRNLGGFVDENTLRNEVMNPEGTGLAETTNQVGLTALNMIVPGAGAAVGAAQQGSKAVGQTIGGDKGGIIAENLTNPFKRMANFHRYGVKGMTGDAQMGIVQGQIDAANRHEIINDENLPMKFRRGGNLPNIMPNLRSQFEMGGDMGIPNMGMEEMGMQSPSGAALDYNEYEGNSHEEGGIALGNEAEVEGGEVRVEDYIFSDYLKDPISNKTFAELAKKINKKYEGRGDHDAPTNRAKEKELTALMQTNELIRIQEEEREAQELAMAQEQEAMMQQGEEELANEMEVNPQQSQEMPIQDDMGMMPDDMGMESELPMFRRGGNLKQYRPGGNLIGGPTFPNLNIDEINRNILPNETKDEYSLRMNKLGYDPTTAGEKFDSNNVQPLKNTSSIFDPGSLIQDGNNIDMGYAASMISPITNLAIASRAENRRSPKMELARPDFSQYRETIKDQVALNDNIGRENIRRGSAGSSGANLAAQTANRAGAVGSSINAFREAFGTEINARNQIENQERQINFQTALQDQEINEQNRGMQRTVQSMAASQIGDNTQGFVRDKAARDANQDFMKLQLNLINQMYPNYEFLSPEEKEIANKNIIRAFENSLGVNYKQV